MNEQPLFRSEATATIENSISSALVDRRLNRGSGLLPIFLLFAALAAGAMFVQVSLGVSAKGVIRAKSGAEPVIAEQSGVLSMTISERDPIAVKAGTPIATIRNIDLVTLRRAPNVKFSKADLVARKGRLEIRLAEIRAVYTSKTKQISALETSLEQLSEKVSGLLPVYHQEIGRYQQLLAEQEQLLSKGIVRKDQVEIVRNRLVELRLQLKEAQIRIGDFGRQRSELDLQTSQLKGEYGNSLLEVQNALADIEVSMQAETDLETSEVRMPRKGTLIPRRPLGGASCSYGRSNSLRCRRADANLYLFEADLPTGQIGGLKEGLSAKIAVTAYPFFEYGFIDGHVRILSKVPNQSIEFSKDLPVDSRFRIVVDPDPVAIKVFASGKESGPRHDRGYSHQEGVGALVATPLRPALQALSSRVNL